MIDSGRVCIGKDQHVDESKYLKGVFSRGAGEARARRVVVTRGELHCDESQIFKARELLYYAQ